MSISHYWVSGIQVAGLIVGLYGFFFLSIGIFGVKSTPWFRALLPATAVWLGAGLLDLATPPVDTVSVVIPQVIGLVVYIVASRAPPGSFIAERADKVKRYFLG